MGRARAKDAGYGGVKSFPSPASSSASSSEFEFTVTQSPGSKQRSAAQLCPADDLFYKGQLLPLHLSPRISMVRTLLLASASTSSASASDSTSTSRDSNGSTSSSFSTDCAALLLPDSAPSSSRPSSATDDDRHLNLLRGTASYAGLPPAKRTGKQYLSSFATRFSSVFLHRGASPAAKKPSNKSLAKEVIKKYAKKVKPLYEKLSQIPKNQSNQPPPPQPPAQQQQQQCFKKPFSFSIRKKRGDEDHAAASAAAAATEVSAGKYAHSNSFSGNLRFPRQKRCAASCPSSMRSSPNHSGMLSFGGAGGVGFPDVPAAAAAAMTGSIGIGPVSLSAASSSSMEELQSAIEGAIAHCKNTMGGVVSLCPRKGAAAATAGEISAF
ncbi:hypothetical protein ZWY2020_043401 [Hordeum vulgare]|nr:hypothetical protein ZWY2020_043401 [Hordeum vulgare]